jgi:hypothetical protein
VRKSGPRAPHHRPGPHAPGPSAPPRVDARAADRVGPHHRPADRRPRPGDPRGSAAATARRLPGPADAENLFWGVGRGGVPRARLRGRFSRTSTSPGAAITTTTTRRPPLCSGEVRAMATGVASCQSPWVLDVTRELGVGRRGNGQQAEEEGDHCDARSCGPGVWAPISPPRRPGRYRLRPVAIPRAAGPRRGSRAGARSAAREARGPVRPARLSYRTPAVSTVPCSRHAQTPP